MSSMSSMSLVQVALQPNVQTSSADVSPVAWCHHRSGGCSVVDVELGLAWWPDRLLVAWWHHRHQRLRRMIGTHQHLDPNFFFCIVVVFSNIIDVVVIICIVAVIFISIIIFIMSLWFARFIAPSSHTHRMTKDVGTKTKVRKNEHWCAT